MGNPDFKLAASLLATALTVYAYIPYFRDIFRNKTKPHLYTWVVWVITEGTAATAIWHSGGNYAAFSFAADTVLVAAVGLLSLKYGTKNITRGDTAVFAAALLAVIIWWLLESPLLAVLMVAIIDGLGYAPTIRKSFADPWSETLSFWFMMAAINVLAIISIADYNLVTIAYPAVILVANISVWSVCFFRRKPAAVQGEFGA
ncbi:MAG: hypothetical protein WC120_02280 [Parcubacteria group bacterium]